MSFKRGDIVKCLKTYPGQFTRGRTYEVLNHNGNVLSFLKDDEGTRNAWHKSYFKLVKDQNANRPIWSEEKKMKSTVTYLLTKGSITLQYSGQTKVIAKDDNRFEKVLAAIRAGKQSDIPEIVDPTAQFKKAGIEVEEGLLKVKGMAMPPELNARIMEHKQQNVPFQSLLNFWNKLQSNPSFHVRAHLFKFMENHGHSLTEEGDVIGYRGVTDDFKDVHSKTFDNRPGQICSMPRHLVDDNPNNSCSHGLHIGGFEYAKSFGPKLVTVKFKPEDVVAVPDAYKGNKLRVCEFEVLSEAQNPVKEPVVTGKGKKVEKFQEETSQAPSHAQVAKDLKQFDRENMTPAQKRAHAKRYSNNYAKRGKDGKFASKKKRK